MKIKNNNYPSQNFRNLVNKMGLPDLENLIIGLSDDMRCNAEKISTCLSQRKYLLRKQFECSPENVARFGEVMLMLKEQTATIFNATKTLYRQLYSQLQDGQTNGFSDFTLETSLKIAFEDDDSVLELGDCTESKYVQMAEILDSYYSDHWGGNLVDASLYYYQDRQTEEFDDDFFIQEFGCHYDEFQDDWADEWFKIYFPQLSQFPFPYAAHQMLSHAAYTLQDVVRIKTFRSEINVNYQI